MAKIGIDPGTVIGRDFRVDKHLASGAMGDVYVVHQLSTGKERAMKVMSGDLVNNDRARDRFVLEAKVGSKVESDHVVEVVSAGIDEDLGVPYLVMELLKGEELADLAWRRKTLPLPEVAEILKQAGHALEKAHAQGIVHRDIKPENLFIAESRREGVPFTVKILDFGIAKLVSERTVEGTQPVGTPLFMSPEQTDRQGKIGPPTDVWPLGLMAFALLTGKSYWLTAEGGISQLLREVVMEPLVPASQRAQELGVAERLPAGFDGWFGRCVIRDPAQRFPEGGACVRAFAEMAGVSLSGAVAQIPSPGGARGTSPVAATVATDPALLAAGSTNAALSSTTQPSSGGKMGAVAVAGLLVVGGVGAFFATRGGDEATAPTPAASAAPALSTAPSAVPEGCPEGMVQIEEGNMFMGATDEDLDDDVRPPHKVHLSSYCLDVKEVTASAYRACIDSGNCLRADVEVAFEGLAEKDAPVYAELCNLGHDDRGTHPVNCVTWSEADNFCRTKGGRLEDGGARLPTEAEWEFAARGSGQRKYPWGDDPPGPTHLNACGAECVAWAKEKKVPSYGQMFEGDDGFPATAPVGSFEGGASSAGVLDLAGNVWEWTGDWYGPYASGVADDPKGPAEGTERVVRGGGFNGLKPAWAKPAYRWKTTPETKSHGIGFRCAK